MKYKNRIVCAMAALILLCALTGCAQSAAPTETTLPEFTQVTEETTPTEETFPAAPLQEKEPDLSRLPRLAAYQAVLERLCSDLIAPDGQELVLDPSFGDMSQNTFAIADVDGSQGEELVIWFRTGPTAAHCAWVCGYDEEADSIYVETAVYPLTDFYTGGLLRAGWSHNQGLAGGDFWPYTLMGYNPADRTYEVIAHVDAWDRTYRAFDFENKPFPKDIDREDAGIIFFVTQNGETETLSKTDYTAWEEAIFGSARPIELEPLPITEENIQAVTNM